MKSYIHGANCSKYLKLCLLISCQVKELGATFHNCKCAVQDLNKIFQVNWLMGVEGAKIPDKWPKAVQTNINKGTFIGYFF